MSTVTTTRTQKLTLIAILSAISFGLMLFPQVPIIPGASFLKLDFSIVPIIIAGYWIDISAAMWTVVLRTLLKLILANEGVNTYLGLPVNLVAVIIFSVIMLWIMPYVTSKNIGRSLLAILLATIGMTGSAVIMNWFVAVPLYAQFANFNIAKIIGLSRYFIAMVLPFNLIQGIVWGGVSLIVLSIVKPLQNKLTS
ncbi:MULTISPECIES: ECF transporter S component [Leuconostoc]|uniref:Riboflavin transporter n=2 Tax=Leuconostoc TaxID=1243 RepID=A0AAN2QVG0_9LACO|nr:MULTISPECIES: ECF transporter S component [Leuconostoc]MBR2277258.1 ECF transporter S component [Leuconostoc sp.]MBZ5943669.1 ECF transporter S component [Leuconostoc gasicomitatum]MBZ5946689.1 ECF transporter S component [Leuconostoc gasicomitatum]MBZ5948215.1 ECF transporter S component [Leuconostoc gasicomitatum]MBZ5949957.1 ECF transporter S component [Leuconostoc gasicomitatum]